MQFSNMFKNIGRIAVHWYLLFQHHTTLDILRATPDERDLFTITGTGWHFIKYLGPAVVVVGPDTRAERNPHQVSLKGITELILFWVKVAYSCPGHGWSYLPRPLSTARELAWKRPAHYHDVVCSNHLSEA